MIKRKLLSKLIAHLKNPEIALIVGPRQAGKTTLMKVLQKHLDQKGTSTLFLNYDIEAEKPFFASQEILLNKIKLEIGDRGGAGDSDSGGHEGRGDSNRILGVVFLDEIQRKENAGLFLKGLYDMKLPYKFVVSGSGSLELKENIHESLAGRKRIFNLDTLSFEEFTNHKTDYKYESHLSEYLTLHPAQAQILLREYLSFGGYPRAVLTSTQDEKAQIVNEIYRSWLERDISYLGVKKTEAFSQLMRFLAAQTGQIINYSFLSKSLGISVKTVKDYLWYAEKTFVIKKIPPYFRNVKKEIVKSPVYHFRDLGLRNFILGEFDLLSDRSYGRGDGGLLFENFVFLRLLKNLEVSLGDIKFWRTKYGSEVDFVVQRGSQVFPVEAKYSNFRTPEISRSLRSFITAYSPARAYIINLNLDSIEQVGNTDVIFVPFYGDLRF